MITYKDIKKSINTMLINRFNKTINANDVKEGFDRPSFFVDFDNVNPGKSLTQIEKSFTTRIYYFPESISNNSMELLEVMEDLEMLFDLKLPVKDRLFNITDVNSGITDGVLQFAFDIYFEEGREVVMEDTDYTNLDRENDIELMQTLDLKKTIKE